MNPFTEIMRNGAEIAGAIIGLTALGLLISNSQGTANIIGATSAGFGGLLATATFQNGGLRSPTGNVFNPL